MLPLNGAVGSAWHHDLALSERRLDLLHQVRQLLRNDLVVNQLGQRVHQVLVLRLLDLSEDLHVGRGLLKVLSPDGLHIIQLRLPGLSRPLDLASEVVHILLHLVSCLLDLLAFPLQIVLLRPDLHNLPTRTFEVLLQLLQLSPLLEQGLRRSPALVLKNLLPLQVRAFRALHELVSVVLVPNLKVV